MAEELWESSTGQRDGRTHTVYISTVPWKPEPEQGLDTMEGRSSHLEKTMTSVSPGSTSPNQLPRGAETQIMNCIFLLNFY